MLYWRTVFVTDKELLEHIIAYGMAKTETEKNVIVEKVRGMAPEQFRYLLQCGSKSDWWAQSQILIALGYPCVKPALSGLFRWLQDMNWPGAFPVRDEILLKIDKKELLHSFSSALREAWKTGDSDWLYCLSLFSGDIGYSRDDFSESDNAYDILLFHGAMYDKDGDPIEDYMDKYLQLLHEWGYPRIDQFISYVIAMLNIISPDSIVWDMHIEIIGMIPDRVLDEKIREYVKCVHEIHGR